jgi:outer membrane translocation and assembly module TamA
MFRIVPARVAWLLGAAVAISTSLPTLKAVESSASTAEAAAHLQVLIDRAAKIVDALKLEDSERALRVRDEVAQQYLALGKLHDAGQPAPAELDALHRRFVARLAAQLTPEQVDQVKDGMTYGVVSVTLNGYQQMLPQLTDEQRREIHAQLLEAREYAMDAGSSDAKHALFGKYKGRINNYLSKAGYDLKQAEKERAARRQAIQK